MGIILGVTQPQSRGCSQGIKPKQTEEDLCRNLGEHILQTEFEKKPFLILKDCEVTALSFGLVKGVLDS